MAGVRTHPGITRRILIAFVVLTVLPAAAVSWLGMRAVGNVIEERLVRERAANTAHLLGEMRLPLSQLMMQRLSQMFGQEDEVAAEVNADAIGEAIVSSMTPDQEKEFLAQMHGRGTLPRKVKVGGHEFVLGSAEVRDSTTGRGHTLYLLVDRHVLDEAKAAAVRPILLGAIPVLAAVLAAAFFISRTITRPIRRLSAQIEAQVSPREDSSTAQVVAASSNSGLSTQDSALPVHDIDLDAPHELADLASTFNRMLARLRDTQRRLLETERLAAVGKIASSVAHEVRNPLAGIRMNLQLLQQHLAREKRPDESLDIAIAELDRLDSIVQEMLILGRKAEPKLGRVDLREIAAETLALLDRRLKHGGITTALEGEAAIVQADAGQIKQVLLNLILNALDAMPQGGQLTLRILSSDESKRIEIDDTGSGLAMAVGTDPFEWFSTSKSAGSGIGLAVCRQIVEAHGGRIGLARWEGGTRAWLEL